MIVALTLLTGCGRPLALARTTATRTPRPAATSADGAPAASATATLGQAAQPGAASPTLPVAATPTPAVTAGPTATATVSVAPIVPATLAPIGYNERWRQQQRDRVVLSPPQLYTTAGTELYWYDPVFQQSVVLGTFRGDFEVLATFTLRSGDQPALEVLYEVNKRYGLTSLSPALIARIEAAGYTSGFIDTYVLYDQRVMPKGS